MRRLAVLPLVLAFGGCAELTQMQASMSDTPAAVYEAPGYDDYLATCRSIVRACVTGDTVRGAACDRFADMAGPAAMQTADQGRRIDAMTRSCLLAYGYRDGWAVGAHPQDRDPRAAPYRSHALQPHIGPDEHARERSYHLHVGPTGSYGHTHRPAYADPRVVTPDGPRALPPTPWPWLGGHAAPPAASAD